MGNFSLQNSSTREANVIADFTEMQHLGDDARWESNFIIIDITRSTRRINQSIPQFMFHLPLISLYLFVFTFPLPSFSIVFLDSVVWSKICRGILWAKGWPFSSDLLIISSFSVPDMLPIWRCFHGKCNLVFFYCEELVISISFRSQWYCTRTRRRNTVYYAISERLLERGLTDCGECFS